MLSLKNINCILRLILFFTIALIQQSCAYRGQTYSTLSNGFPILKSYNGRIFFYRDNRYSGSAIQPNLYIDGEVIGSSIPGSFFYLDKPEGVYKIKCDNSSISLKVESGKKYYIEMLIFNEDFNPFSSFIWDIRLVNIIKEQAIPILNNMHYVKDK